MNKDEMLKGGLANLIKHADQVVTENSSVKESSDHNSFDTETLKKANWEQFVAAAKEFKNGDDKSSIGQIWVSKDMKKKFEALKIAGVNIPMTHLVSAAMKIVLDSAPEEVERILKNV